MNAAHDQDYQTKLDLILKAVRHAAYATINEDGKPHNLPLMLIYNEDLTKLYIGSYSDSLHVKNLLRIGRAFAALFDSFTKGQGGVYITGVNAHECEDNELVEALRVHNAVRARHGSKPIDINYYQSDKPSQRMYSIEIAKIEVYTVVRGTNGLITSEARLEVEAKELLEGLRMIEVTDKVHRILAPRLVVTIGTKDSSGRLNVIPINNITSISTEPSMVIIAVYKPWITAENLKTAKAFTVSVPHREQLELIWKLGQKYSGYNSGKDKIDEFKDNLDLDFSEHGSVKDALGWVEYKIVDLPEDIGGNHLMVIGEYTKAKISPIGNPKPFMQWERNNLAEASDIFSIDYFNDPGF